MNNAEGVRKRMLCSNRRVKSNSLLTRIDGRTGRSSHLRKIVNPFEVRYAENKLAASISAAATCEMLQTIGKQAATDFSAPGTNFSGEHQHFEVEQPLKPRQLPQAWAQLSWS
jgi:hypothetical protein